MTLQSNDQLVAQPAIPELGQTSNDTNLVQLKLDGYEREWSLYLAALQEMANRGLSIAELLGCFEHIRNHYDGFIDEWVLKRIHCDLGQFTGATSPHRLVAENGRYASVTEAQNCNILFDLIEHCLDPEVDGVVEFGSGLGHNLARLRMRIPNRNGLTYIACEPSASGRQATELLFASDHKAQLRVLPFDYTTSSLDFLSGFRKLVAFTCHSVEQVTVLGADFYQRLLDSPVATCIHLEPFGWQHHTNLVAEVDAFHQNIVARDKLLGSFVYYIDNDMFLANSAAWSLSYAYNTDLLRLISSASDRGDINIFRLGYDILGSNPFNPSSIVAWTRRRRRRQSKSVVNGSG